MGIASNTFSMRACLISNNYVARATADVWDWAFRSASKG
jgi:hypothetical protein